MLHEEMTTYFTTLADFHPAVLRWSGHVLQEQPMLATTFAATLNVIIQQTQLLGIDDETAHELLICLIEHEAGPALRRGGSACPSPLATCSQPWRTRFVKMTKSQKSCFESR